MITPEKPDKMTNTINIQDILQRLQHYHTTQHPFGIGDILVPPQLPANLPPGRSLKIAIVGEAPGEQETRLGVPFMGGAGQVLDLCLKHAGIDRTQCYITNVLKHRPINDDFNLLYTNSDPKRREPTEYLQQCWRFLEEELALAKPNLVIALDKEALRALTGKVSITKWRGSLLRSKTGLNILPSLHPKHVLRVWNEKPILELDLRRAARKCSVASWTPTTYHTVTRPTFTVTMQWLALADAPGSTLSFDIETFHNLGRIRCLGLSTSADPRPNAICIPFIYNINETHVGTTQIQLSLGLEGETKPRAEYANYWTEEQEEALLLRLDKILSNPAIKKVAQNAQFDMTILASDLGLKVRGLYLDTMVAQHCCYAELPKGLDFLASIYTDIPYWSDYNVDVDQETWIYNCYDVIATLQIAKHLETVELKELNQYDFYFEHVHPTILALMDVQDRGLLVDVALQQQQKAATTLIVNTLREKLAAIAGKPEFNPNSPKQLQWLLYEKLALPMKTNKKGKPTADKHSIESLAQSPRCTEHRGLLLELLDYSKQETLLSGFLSKPTAPNGRIYTSLNIAGTVTRRLASSAPLHKVGTNLQNMPRGEFRRLFIATPGWWMIKADLSQAEFRIVCWLAKIQRIIDKYVQSNDFDVHRWVAGLIYGKPEADVTKAERSLAKNGVYGGNYAMRYDKAALVYKMSLQIAKFILDSYHKAIPEIAVWWFNVQRQLATTRCLESPLGGRRLFFGRLDDDTFREAYSHSAQSTVADLMNRALHLCEETFNENDCRVVLQVHDELVLEVRADSTTAQHYIQRLRNIMEYPMRFSGIAEPLVIPADISIGVNWYDQVKPDVFFNTELAKV